MYVLLLNTIRYVNELVNIIIMFVARVGGGGVLLHVMAYMGRLHTKGGPLSGFRYMKG